VCGSSRNSTIGNLPGDHVSGMRLARMSCEMLRDHQGAAEAAATQTTESSSRNNPHDSEIFRVSSRRASPGLPLIATVVQQIRCIRTQHLRQRPDTVAFRLLIRT
jgi:hypothetical protein